MMSMPAWVRFRCNLPKPNTKGFSSDECGELQHVYHVAHVPEARRIIEDHEITAGLIGDASRLKKTRISVTWMSANTWSYGSIYGTVQFKFDWSDLINGKHVYWVEDLAYKNPAYRYLVTDRDLSGSADVDIYDPETDDGPLRLRDGKWYWNDQKTSEFMLDRSISLDLCKEITFISHKADSCSDHGWSCKELNITPSYTAAVILAYLIGRSLTSVRDCLVRLDSNDETTHNHMVRFGLRTLLQDLSEDPISGSHSSSGRAQVILRGALLQYGHGQRDDAMALVRLLESKKVLKKTLERLAGKFLNLQDYQIE